VQKIRGSDTNSRPSTLVPRGHHVVAPVAANPQEPTAREWVEALERVVPTMRGQDNFFASSNLSTYKNLSVGYTFNPDDDDRHLVWPQRYPAEWDSYIAERFGIGRAAFLVFDFVGRPEHSLADHYWVVAQFSKSNDPGQLREYGRGLWEVVPAHRYPDAAAVAARVREFNPPSHFDDDDDHHYAYRMVTSGETVVIHNRFGSTATEQAIVEIRSPAGEVVPLNRYTADVRDEAGLRGLPLMDVWQVDSYYQFTDRKYGYADGRGRVTVNNPFVGENLAIDSSDYRFPSRSVSDTNLTAVQLPALPNTAGQVSNVSALALAGDRLYATHYCFPAPGPTPSPQPGELLVLDRSSLTVLNQLPVGRSPHSIAVHETSQTVYVLNYDDISLKVVDGAAFTPVQTIVFPGFGPTEVAISQKYHRVYVTQPGQKRVVVLDGRTLTQMPDIANLPLTGALAVHEHTDRLYVSALNAQDPQRQDVIEFEIHTGGQTEVRRATVDNQVSRAPRFALDDDRLHVLGYGPRPGHGPGQKLMILDRDDLSLTAEIPLITGGGLAVGVSGSQGSPACPPSAMCRWSTSGHGRCCADTGSRAR
ncbi:MAG: YncE family protein, partial [Pseudonocardiaceae bacterium]